MWVDTGGVISSLRETDVGLWAPYGAGVSPSYMEMAISVKRNCVMGIQEMPPCSRPYPGLGLYMGVASYNRFRGLNNKN